MTLKSADGGDAVSPVAAIYLIWVLWFAAWLIAATAAKREPGALHGLVALAFYLIVAAAMLFLLVVFRPWQGIDLQHQLWERGIPDALGWALVVVALAGFGLAGWATLHRLSRLKHGDTLVDSGPYARVRHPVYLGLIVAAAVTALVFGQPTSLLGMSLLAGALIGKVVMEERATNDEAHRAYRRRVPMLVPFWPMGVADEVPRDVAG